MDNMVGSAHPGGEEAPKGLTVRQLKRHVSWVQTVDKPNFGLWTVWIHLRYRIAAAQKS